MNKQNDEKFSGSKLNFIRKINNSKATPHHGQWAFTGIAVSYLTSNPANCQPDPLSLGVFTIGAAFSSSHVADASSLPDVACKALIQSSSWKPSSTSRLTTVSVKKAI